MQARFESYSGPRHMWRGRQSRMRPTGAACGSGGPGTCARPLEAACCGLPGLAWSHADEAAVACGRLGERSVERDQAGIELLCQREIGGVVDR
jgi:hypothetical protein